MPVVTDPQGERFALKLREGVAWTAPTRARAEHVRRFLLAMVANDREGVK